MNVIDKVDILMNAVSMNGLYGAVEAELRRQNELDPEDAYSEEEIDSLCMEAVARALEKTAQPKRATQKSAAFLGSRSGLHRTAFFMGSESINKFAQLYLLIAQGKHATAAGMFLMFSAMEQAIVYAYRELFSGGDDDEDKL